MRRDNPSVKARAAGLQLSSLILISACLLISLTVSTTAGADERLPPLPEIDEDHPSHEDPGYADPSSVYAPFSSEWTGAYLGLGVEGGLALSNHYIFDGVMPSSSVGGFLAFSSPFHLAHGQGSINYQTGHVQTRSGGGAMQRLTLRNSVMIHPLFALLMMGSKYGYIAGSFHILVGMSLDHIQLREGPRTEKFWNMSWHIGAGFDAPLKKPWAGRSWWIGAQWRFEETPGPMDIADYARNPVRTHVLALRLSFRHHGLLIRRGVRPDAP